MNRRVIPAVIGCSALLFVAGCGSSSSSSSSSSSTASAPPATTASTAATTASTPAAAAAPTSSGAVQSGTVEVAYRNVAIAPTAIKVKVGSTVKWTDFDAVTHNVTSQSGPAHFSSPNLTQGSTFSFKVTKPGVIHYQCTFHPASMNGTIEVVK